MYGQQEVVKDLIRARIEAGGTILFNVTDVTLHDIATNAPRLHFTHDGERTEIACDIIAGCDGFHGVCRQSIPPGVLSAVRARLSVRVARHPRQGAADA